MLFIISFIVIKKDGNMPRSVIGMDTLFLWHGVAYARIMEWDGVSGCEL